MPSLRLPSSASIHSAAVLLFGPVLLTLLVGCGGDAVECIIDGDCATGQYCVSTRCADPVPVGDIRQSYVEQVAPIIETGCNCHGPGTDRPWSFTHDFADQAAFDADLAVLRQWLYDPLDPPGIAAEGSRPTGWVYGVAGCGFNHPGIYEGPLQGQYALLLAWAAQAWAELPIVGAQDVPVPPVEAPAEGPLPELEKEALERIRTLPYRAVMEQEIVPRVVGQCGCCHAGDGARGWTLVSRYPALDAEGNPIDPRTMDPLTATQLMDRDIASVEAMTDRLNPDRAQLLRYGLGANGRVEAHPVIYSGPDDPRYRLLREWMAQGPPPPAN